MAFSLVIRDVGCCLGIAPGDRLLKRSAWLIPLIDDKVLPTTLMETVCPIYA